MQFHDQTLADSFSAVGGIWGRRANAPARFCLPGQGASGKIARFARRCFALIVTPIFFCPPGKTT
jgi:hypothetical protein